MTKAVEDFKHEIFTRVRNARVVHMAEDERTVNSLLYEKPIKLTTKKHTFDKDFRQVAKFIQGHVDGLIKTGDSNLSVIVGIGQVSLDKDKVDINIGFARDDGADPATEVEDTLISAVPADAKASDLKVEINNAKK